MQNNRRDFLLLSARAAAGLAFFSALPSFGFTSEENKSDYKLSLAQWSLHKALFGKQLDPLDFPVVAKKTYGISAVEYVSQFYKDKAGDKGYLAELKKRCSDNGVYSHLIMIDQEGNLADKSASARKQAVENHYKWVEAAKFLDCASIRVNLHGDSNAEEWSAGAAESLARLGDFAAPLGINILAENHGTFSSNGKMLADVVKGVNKKNVGTLVDFANFCVRREKGDLWESPCVDFYDPYKGVEELLPYAKGVSAKSFDFDKNGNEVKTDFLKMMQIVKKSGFKGYVGVEYEGSVLPEDEGIKATKKLLEKVFAQV
jgi:sugar phosphate isomerase/epimerase